MLNTSPRPRTAVSRLAYQRYVLLREPNNAVLIFHRRAPRARLAPFARAALLPGAADVRSIVLRFACTSLRKNISPTPRREYAIPRDSSRGERMSILLTNAQRSLYMLSACGRGSQLWSVRPPACQALSATRSPFGDVSRPSPTARRLDSTLGSLTFSHR